MLGTMLGWIKATTPIITAIKTIIGIKKKPQKTKPGTTKTETNTDIRVNLKVALGNILNLDINYQQSQSAINQQSQNAINQQSQNAINQQSQNAIDQQSQNTNLHNPHLTQEEE